MNDGIEIINAVNKAQEEAYFLGWNEALEEVFNKLHASYFVDGKPALVIHEDNSQRLAMPEIFELINTLKK